MRKTYSLLIGPVAVALLSGCFGMNGKGPASVNQIMPDMNAHYAIVRKQIKSEKWEPAPSADLIALEKLFQDLKSSNKQFYAKDTAAWDRYCDQGETATRNLEQAWSTKNADAIKSAFSELTRVRDEAHQAFRGHK